VETTTPKSKEPLDALGHTPRFKFAHNYVDLAKTLGVTRQTLHNWNQLEGAPVPNSNGTHDVRKWQEFVREKKLKGGEIVTDGEKRLKARKRLAEGRCFARSLSRNSHQFYPASTR
jgi:hypothetical protein